MKAVIISSDADQRDFLAYVLRHAGLETRQASNPETVIAGWLDSPADLVLLCGRERSELEGALKELRAASGATPAILLLEAPTESAICTLLDAGADLVLSLPVGPSVLAAYCHTLLRRSRSVPAFSLPKLDLGTIALDPSTRMVRIEGRDPQRLTQLEFRLLYALMTHRGEVIPSELIVDRVWGYSESGSRELVRGLVSRLRAKIEPDRSTQRFVHTVPGVGYFFDHEAAETPQD